MINFVVVDDNDVHRKNICKTIVTNMMSNKIDFYVQEFKDYSKELLGYIKQNKQNTVYILDLELKSGDGIDVARVIRNECNNWLSPIIIITAHTSLYYEVYKQRLQILDFIAKCSDMKKNISENIDICLKMLNEEKVYRYCYKNVDYTIHLNDIDYVQRDGRQTKIVTKEKTYFQNISVNNIILKLPNYFVTSSKGSVINIKNVDNFDWKSYKVSFIDGISAYLLSKNHKKEIETNEYYK